MRTDTFLCRVVQIDYHCLLSRIYLHDYRFSFRNVSASYKSGIYDDRKDNNDWESDVGAAGLGANGYGKFQRGTQDGHGVLCRRMNGISEFDAGRGCEVDVTEKSY